MGERLKGQMFLLAFDDDVGAVRFEGFCAMMAALYEELAPHVVGRYSAHALHGALEVEKGGGG